MGRILNRYNISQPSRITALPAFWRSRQERIAAGFVEDFFPYPEELRFRNQFAG